MAARAQTNSVKGVLKELKENESSISMVLGGLVVLVVGILLFNYFKKATPEAQVTPEAATITQQGVQYEKAEDGTMTPKNLPETYTVAKGDHLWAIAEKYYGSGYNWVDIAKANKLGNGSVLFVGKELTLPKVALRLPVGVEPTAPAATKGGETVMAPSTPTSITGDSYTVVKGDHLWKIAVAAYGDGYAWTKIWKANTATIKNPSSIEVGMKLMLPR